MTLPSRALMGALLAVALVASGCAQLPGLDEGALAPASESTKIYAADGSLITTLEQEENREIIPVGEIPKHVRDAVIAIEDSRFFAHRGFDAKAILRALWANARSGKVVEGGSTITQQLVRNAIQDVGKEKTLQRKLKEATYAWQLEGAFSKKKILELYLNTVYFGEGAYGIQTAAQTYFDKSAKELTLPEGALLAGLIRSPVAYNPYTNAEDAVARRNLVLGRMGRLGLVDEPGAEAAKSAGLGVQERANTPRYPAPYFVDLVTRQVQHAREFLPLGESVNARANRLFRGGLRIHTTLDPKTQAAAEAAIAGVLDHPAQDPSGTLVAIDPKNGHVKALVGGPDYFATERDDPCVRVGAVNADGSPKTCAKVNLALGRAGGGSGRQSGSAFKPFVLATALTKGKRLSDVYRASGCIDIPNADAGGTQPWRVCNYEESGFGPMDVRDATVRSVNVVYAQMIMDVGAAAVVETADRMGVGGTARRMGLDTRLDSVPSAALGANAVSPLDMASAFGAFPNSGVLVSPVAITRITDSEGKVLWKPVQQRRQVLNPGVAYLTTRVLEEVIERGTAAQNGKLGRPAFGKTGTAQEWRDAWFVGGAGTDLVAAVSVFWPDYEIEMKASCGDERTTYTIKDGVVLPPTCRPTRIKVSGGTWPTQIWQRFMLEALQGVPPSEFPVPEFELASVKVDVTRGCLPNLYTPSELIQTQTFLNGTEPTEVCRQPAGPILAVVPSVIGQLEEQAVRVLEQAGFEVDTKQEPARLHPPGRVIRQDPPEGTELSSGKEVTIWVADESSRREVPDVVNLTELQAQELLENSGFEVEAVRDPGCNPQSRCLVSEQSPKAGTPVEDGSEVTIHLRPARRASPSPSRSPSP